MKNIIAHIVGGKTLTYFAAAFAALATSSAWASFVWTGEGADEYYGTTGNTPGGPAGRGFFFVDGITDLDGVVRNAKNWTARFNSYTYIAGTSIYIGRASQTDSDKIWTIIPDNDECGFYLQNGYDLCVGWEANYGDGYLSMPNGKFAFRNLYIGPNVDNPTTKGVLSIGSAGHASTVTLGGFIQIHNGDLTTIDTTLTCGDLEAANKGNTTVTIDKTGGDWCVNGILKMATGSGSTATFYNRGGDLVVTNNLTVQYSGSGEFYMEGGHVTVSNMVRFADDYLEKPNVANLYLNGGVFEAKMFRFHNSDWSTGNVVLNGGTYRAMADGSIASTEGRRGALACLYFVVGANGGTIDTAGHDVVIPLKMQSYNGATGGLMVKGGGSLTLESANINYTGYTSIEPGTTLIVSNATAKSNILSHGLVVAGVPTAGQTIFTYAEALTADDLANVSCPLAPDTVFAVGGEDNKSIVVQSVAGTMSGNHWTGAAGDNNLSTPGNWSDGVVPTDNAVIIVTNAVTLAQGNSFAPASITFLAGDAVTISGSGLTLTSVTNLSSLAPTFACPVTFADNYRVHSESSAVNFAGGATATCPASDMTDNAASHTLMGNITFTADTWTATVSSDSTSWTVPSGSRLYGKALTGNCSQKTILTVAAGGYAEFDSVLTGRNLGRISVRGEMVVNGTWVATADGVNYSHIGFDGDQNGNGIVRAKGIWKGDDSHIMNRSLYVKIPHLYVGSDGLGAKRQDYSIVFDAGTPTIHATDNFEIFGPQRSGNLWDWGVILSVPVTFNTQGHTINWTAGADGAGALIKDGEGTLIFNPYGTRISGAVTVKGGTLRVMCTSVYSSFASTTVKDGATLEVAAGATLGSNGVTLEAGSTLALTAASSTFTALSNAVTLPTGEGEVVTIRIDGERLLSGDHTILSDVKAGATANVALDMTSAALAGRKRASLRVDGSDLVLNIVATGTVIFVR